MAIITVPIELDRKRNLAMTLGAMRALKNRQVSLPGIDPTASVEPFQVIADAFNAMDFETISFVLWACLRHEDPELQQADMDNMIDVANLPTVILALTTLITQSSDAAKEAMPSPPKGAKTNGLPLAPRGTGRALKHTDDSTSA